MKKPATNGVVKATCLVCRLELEVHRAQTCASYAVTYGRRFVCDACGRHLVKALLAVHDCTPKDAIVGVARHYAADPEPDNSR